MSDKEESAAAKWIAAFLYAGDAGLVCPGIECDSEMTHIDDVLVIPGETAIDRGLHIHAGGEDEHTTIRVGSTNERHFGRRHAIVLVGYCEHCGQPFELWFVQHKGVTKCRVVLGLHVSLDLDLPQ